MTQVSTSEMRGGMKIIVDGQAYSIVFYSADEVIGTDTNQLELIDPAAVPIKTWNILNPDPGTLQRLARTGKALLVHTAIGKLYHVGGKGKAHLF